MEEWLSVLAPCPGIVRQCTPYTLYSTQALGSGGTQNGGMVISSGSVPGHSEALYTVHTVQYTGSGFRRYAEWRNGYQFWLRARAW
ncbi:hypothetical protein RRG08_026800 [Elysia crispata]|uniref:Uncharacterized protein n=1 Tax=Elysia crispata TaxID=231223 RepID=A0AAE1AQA0_9GAST|nr:hypothetical protein RRG08_026800 [Elysia crispata]